MALNLLIMCVGIESVGHLERVTAKELADAKRLNEPPYLKHWTRNRPRRADELSAGGSLYWIIKGAIRVRQPIVGIEALENPVGGKRCCILYGPELIRTLPVPRDPMQGWRYLEAKDAPPDLESVPEEAGDMPPEMVAELRSLGLL
ncbi:MAG: DUF1489 domain-containing protein [Proteobacteria bacterium]|nr:DUF1489 domain-containing protein [Pseudomonadota bacterium]